MGVVIYLGQMTQVQVRIKLRSRKTHMTQHFLDDLCKQSCENFDLDDCLIIHRFGDIQPADPIVLTAVWSAHRAEAFDACRFLMEELKAHAPFWKKEVTEEGERWVHNDQKPVE